MNTPNTEESQHIMEEFMSDLKSFSYQKDGCHYPIICAVCDGMPCTANWFEWVDTKTLERMCVKNKMTHTDIIKYYTETPELVEQYKADHLDLKHCILSPKSQLLHDKIIVCKQCLSELKKNERQVNYRNPPKGSIANGYLIGEAPEVLTQLNAVELAIVSRVRIYSQSWTFFAGCHEHIKGWHTFFRNRHLTTMAHLNLISTTTMKDNLMVVLCGPFTKEQEAMVRIAVRVNIEHVQEAIAWLIKNNYHYFNDKIPTEDEIPVPIILTDNKTGM